MMDWTNFSWGPFESKLLWYILRNLALNGMGAYFVTRLSAVRRALTGTRSRRLDTLVLILVFGLFSILGNFLGLPIHGAIANTRIVGPIAGGLIGGPWVGAGAGILGGLVRYAMGGYTALAALVANVLAGLVGGWVQTGLGYRRITVPVAFLTGVAGELVLKACILTLSKPFDMAWKLEKTIPEVVRRINAISASSGLRIPIFGHAGDGNLHPSVLCDLADPDQAARAHQAVDGIFQAALNLGGTLSGEHGIGITKRPYFADAAGPVSLETHRAVKRALDPLGLLNPGKIW